MEDLWKPLSQLQAFGISQVVNVNGTQLTAAPHQHHSQPYPRPPITQEVCAIRQEMMSNVISFAGLEGGLKKATEGSSNQLISLIQQQQSCSANSQPSWSFPASSTHSLIVDLSSSTAASKAHIPETAPETAILKRTNVDFKRPGAYECSSIHQQQGQTIPVNAATANKPLKTLTSTCTFRLRVSTLGSQGFPISGELFFTDKGRLEVVCSCHGWPMPVAKFVQHAGSHVVNPGNVVYLENGETLLQWRKSLFSRLGVKVDDEVGWDWHDSACEADRNRYRVEDVLKVNDTYISCQPTLPESFNYGNYQDSVLQTLSRHANVAADYIPRAQRLQENLLNFQKVANARTKPTEFGECFDFINRAAGVYPSQAGIRATAVNNDGARNRWESVRSDNLASSFELRLGQPSQQAHKVGTAFRARFEASEMDRPVHHEAYKKVPAARLDHEHGVLTGHSDTQSSQQRSINVLNINHSGLERSAVGERTKPWWPETHNAETSMNANDGDNGRRDLVIKQKFRSNLDDVMGLGHGFSAARIYSEATWTQKTTEAGKVVHCDGSPHLSQNILQCKTSTGPDEHYVLQDQATSVDGRQRCLPVAEPEQNPAEKEMLAISTTCSIGTTQFPCEASGKAWERNELRRVDKDPSKKKTFDTDDSLLDGRLGQSTSILANSGLVVENDSCETETGKKLSAPACLVSQPFEWRACGNTPAGAREYDILSEKSTSVETESKEELPSDISSKSSENVLSASTDARENDETSTVESDEGWGCSPAEPRKTLESTGSAEETPCTSSQATLEEEDGAGKEKKAKKWRCLSDGNLSEIIAGGKKQKRAARSRSDLTKGKKKKQQAPLRIRLRNRDKELDADESKPVIVRRSTTGNSKMMSLKSIMEVSAEQSYKDASAEQSCNEEDRKRKLSELAGISFRPFRVGPSLVPRGERSPRGARPRNTHVVEERNATLVLKRRREDKNTACEVSKRIKSSADPQSTMTFGSHKVKYEGSYKQDSCFVCNGSKSGAHNQLIRCSSCVVKVHQACYGVPKVPKASWTCRPCKSDSKNIVCVLCGYGSGAMTRAQNTRGVVKGLLREWNVTGSKLEEQPRRSLRSSYKQTGHQVSNTITAWLADPSATQWVHMVCALWMPGTRCLNLGTMGMFDVSGVSAARRRLTCSICKRQGGSCIQCHEPKCAVPFHAWCAHAKDLLQIEAVNDTSGHVRFQGRCPTHVSGKYARTEASKNVSKAASVS